MLGAGRKVAGNGAASWWWTSMLSFVSGVDVAAARVLATSEFATLLSC